MKTFVGAACLIGLLVAGCSGAGASNDATDDSRLHVATTVAPLTDIVATIAGDRARVEGLVPEGTNSHTYEPAPKVAELLSTADLIFVNGLGLEEPTAALADRVKRPDTKVVELGERVLPRRDWIFDFSFPREGGKPNPHLWTDPTYAVRYAAVIRDDLAAADPAGAANYRANYRTFAAQADQLAAALRADQQSVPVQRRKLLTHHDAYAYFARTFEWTVVGAVQPQNFEDPTPAELARLIEQVRRERVPTVFGSEVFPSKVLAEIGRATGARYEDTLRDDDLPGRPGDPEHSWLGLMRYDYRTMIRGLGGSTPRLDRLTFAPATASAVFPQ
jgi:ABC-type Zn uptake system ZnuABC Zn-binding protein ZnuA